MCVDENAAAHAVSYLNAQLVELHGSARKCLSDHPQARSEENKYYYALAEFVVQRPGASSRIPSQSDSLFHACFGAPKLKFICDHDVLIQLTLNKGHVTLPSSRAGRGETVPLPSEGLRVTYRVHFDTRRIVGNDAKIGDCESVIELVVLDLKSATVSSVQPEQISGREVILKYLVQYLDLLHDAGNHVLFSLPQFSPHISQHIDYSLVGGATEHEWLETIYGVSIGKINAYMSSLWLKSAMLVYGSAATERKLACCLAEYTHTEESYFRIKFGAPRVKALCAREVMLYFDVEKLEIFEGQDFSKTPTRTYTKWKVAMLVDIELAQSTDDEAVTIKFDLFNCRYHHTLSVYEGLDEEDTISLGHRDLLIQFFEDEYLDILYRAGYHIIYSHDLRWESVSKSKIELIEEAENGWWGADGGDSTGTISAQETIQRAKMHGFDQVVAISQGSINSQLFAQWSNSSIALLRSWAFEQYFSASFKNPCLHLLSADRAILWVHLTSGNLKSLRDWAPCNEGAAYDFADWRLAFEVNLTTSTHAELEGANSAIFAKTSACAQHANRDDRELKHILIDLRHAEYLHEYSIYGNSNPDADDSGTAILRLQAVVYYLTQHYFPALCKEGLNVISSIPVWKPAPSLPSYALTSVAFHVYSEREVTRHTWARVKAGQEPIIVIIGMTGGRTLPADARLKFSTGWIVHANRGFSHGTLAIARRVFIEERLLSMLSNVNALTTLIPVVRDPMLGFEGVDLIKWGEHERLKNRSSEWKLQRASGEGCLKYMWEHIEEWRYKSVGSAGDTMNASESISCITRNFVELPTVVKQGELHITVSGRVELTLARKAEAQSYHATSAVSWSKKVTVQTVGSGIKVNTLGSHEPSYSTTNSADSPPPAGFRSAQAMLSEAFPKTVDLEALVQEIRGFEGAWAHICPPAYPYSLTSPVFNEDGDLLFELCRHGTALPRLAPTSPVVGYAGRMLRPGSPALGRRAHSRAPQQGGRSSSTHSPVRSPIGQGGATISRSSSSFAAGHTSITVTTSG